MLIPCWNDGAHVEEAVASVHGQGVDVHVVVVDDGSTDPATLEALTRLREAGTTVVRQDNAGPAAARNAGLAVADSPFVFALDADDRLADGALPLLVAALDAHPEAAAAWGDTRAFGAYEGVFPNWPELDAWLVTYVNRIPVTALYRTRALRDVGGWRLGGYEDWDVWLRLAAAGWRGAHIGRVHLEYRQHTEVRGLRRDTDRHAELMNQLRRANPEVFADRHRAARTSGVPLRVRVAFRLLEAVPGVPERLRHRLYDQTLRQLVPAVRPWYEGTRAPSPLGAVAHRLRGRLTAGRATA
ncbi:MAG: glycosyltransferase family A protein [Thermoleophilia bacterium]